MAIGQFSNLDGTNVWPSLEAVAARCNQSVRNVERHRPAIVKAGYLSELAPAIRGVRGTEYRLTIPAKTDKSGGSPVEAKTDSSGAKTDNSGSRRPTGLADNQFSTNTGNQSTTDRGGKVLEAAGIKLVDLPSSSEASEADPLTEPPPPVAPSGAPAFAATSSSGSHTLAAAALPPFAPSGAPSPEGKATTYAAAIAAQVPIHKLTHENPYAVERSKKGYQRSMQDEIDTLRDDPRFQHIIEMVESGEIRDWQEAPPQLQGWAARRIKSRE